MDDGCFVYFVRNPANHLVKIGKTLDPHGRLVDLRREYGQGLHVLLWLRGDHGLEARLHKQFKSDRAFNEWFRHSEAIQQFIVEHLPQAADPDKLEHLWVVEHTYLVGEVKELESRLAEIEPYAVDQAIDWFMETTEKHQLEVRDARMEADKLRREVELMRLSYDNRQALQEENIALNSKIGRLEGALATAERRIEELIKQLAEAQTRAQLFEKQLEEEKNRKKGWFR